MQWVMPSQQSSGRKAPNLEAFISHCSSSCSTMAPHWPVLTSTSMACYKLSGLNPFKLLKALCSLWSTKKPLVSNNDMSDRSAYFSNAVSLFTQSWNREVWCLPRRKNHHSHGNTDVRHFFMIAVRTAVSFETRHWFLVPFSKSS